MSPPPVPPPNGTEWLSQLQQSYSQVKFGPGVAGKTARATIAVLAVWALIVWRLTGDWVANAFLMACGLVATGIFCWWVKKTHEFAEKLPQVALLEGAELIEYQKWESAVNGKPIPRGVPVAGPDNAVAIVDETRP